MGRSRSLSIHGIGNRTLNCKKNAVLARVAIFPALPCMLLRVPELPDICLHERSRTAHSGPAASASAIGEFFPAQDCDPPLVRVEGCIVREVRRVGKRIAFGLENDLWLVLHLMIAGRLHWRPRDAKLAGRNQLAAFDFPNGSLVLTELVRSAAPRCISSEARRACVPSIPGVSTSSPAISKPFARHLRLKIGRSKGR